MVSTSGAFASHSNFLSGDADSQAYGHRSVLIYIQRNAFLNKFLNPLASAKSL